MSVSASGQRTWIRDYPPLLAIGAGLLIVLAVLPSSLNFPQANPTQTLEYAPVPPDDNDNPPPAAGNLGSLGLGKSSGIAEGGKPPDPPATVKGLSKDASTKSCVGNPPRQTEDPLSPPCVAYFRGDNFGATYQGVTRDEIRVLFYFEGAAGQSGTSRGQEPSTFNRYFDLAKPPTSDEHIWLRMLRLYQRHFNERYQTYGRLVHFYAYYGHQGIATPEVRRADAAENYERIKPFAVYNQGTYGFGEEYTQQMVRRGVAVFLGAQNVRSLCCTSAKTLRSFNKLLWSVAASTEQYARVFSSVICSRVVGRPVSFGGNAGDQGKPRKLGLIVNRRDSHPEEAHLAMLVKAQVEACGGTFVDQAVNPGNSSTGIAPEPQAGADLARFQREGVTTIIWPVGANTGGDDGYGHSFGYGASSNGWFPEVIIAGNGSSEGQDSGSYQSQEFQRNAFFITQYTKADDFAARPCVQAAREADPAAPRQDLGNFACELYDGVRLMFSGIQVAGPRLGPTSMDEGFHAIPPVASTNPLVPACFFDTDDYSCVKDAMLERWDPLGQDPGASGRGCMRMVEGGKRYLADGWPHRDIAADAKSDDLCNRQGFPLA